MNRFAVLVTAASLCGCAAPADSLREPRLTNPPRVSQWLGDDPSTLPALSQVEARYDGAFRLPLSQDWTWSMPDEGRWEISRLELSTPVVDGDVVLVGNSRRSGLFVLNRVTGLVVKHIDLPGPVQAPPLRLEDGWVVADTFGTVIRYDLDWTPVWSAPYEAGSAILRPPALVDGALLLGTSTDSIISIAVADGVWRWTFKREVARGSQDLAILGAPTPVVVGDEVISGFSDGSVVGLDRNTGVQRWLAQVGGGKFPDVQAEAVPHGDMVLLGAFGGPVVGLDARTHAERWRNEDAGASASMLLAGGSLYTSDARGRVQALNPDTGETEWTWELEDKQFGPPVRAGGWVLVGDVGGTVYALDRFEGTEAWRFRPNDGTRLAGVAAAPAVVGRQVLFPSAAGTLYSLVAEPGSEADPSEEPSNRGDRVLGW